MVSKYASSGSECCVYKTGTNPGTESTQWIIKPVLKAWQNIFSGGSRESLELGWHEPNELLLILILICWIDTCVAAFTYMRAYTHTHRFILIAGILVYILDGSTVTETIMSKTLPSTNWFWHTLTQHQHNINHLNILLQPFNRYNPLHWSKHLHP